MIMYSLIFLLFAVIIISIGIGLAFWLINSKKRKLCTLGSDPNVQSLGSVEADFVEFAVSQKNVDNLENKSDELGQFLLRETIQQGKIINFLGINLKINQIKQENANTITAKTEISIVPVDEEIIYKVTPSRSEPVEGLRAHTEVKAEAVPASKHGIPISNIIGSVIALILFVLSILGISKSSLFDKIGSLFKGKKSISTQISQEKTLPAKTEAPIVDYESKQSEVKQTKPAPRLSYEEIAQLMYPGKVVSNFKVSDMSQENVTQYIGYPGFYIKTRPFSDFVTGSERSLNTIVIAAKQYADLTGDGSEELIVVSIGDDKILPDCMANLSANNVVIYKWNGSNYEEIWRTNMDLGQEGKFDKLEVTQDIIRLHGTRFTHGNGAPFVDSYKWNGETFASY